MKIQAFSLPKAAPKWQFDLAELGTYIPLRESAASKYELKKFLGVWQQELLLACSNGLILALHIETGKETRRFHHCPKYQLGSTVFEKLETAEIFELDQQNHCLIGLYAYFYIFIDLESGKIELKDLSKNMKKNGIGFYRRSSGYAFDNNYIYTIGELSQHQGPKAIGDRSILAFNRHTHQIDWQYIFENDSVNTDIPQLAGEKLYQLTSNMVLHIFEKENHI